MIINGLNLLRVDVSGGCHGFQLWHSNIYVGVSTQMMEKRTIALRVQ